MPPASAVLSDRARTQVSPGQEAQAGPARTRHPGLDGLRGIADTISGRLLSKNGTTLGTVAIALLAAVVGIAQWLTARQRILLDLGRAKKMAPANRGPSLGGNAPRGGNRNLPGLLSCDRACLCTTAPIEPDRRFLAAVLR